MDQKEIKKTNWIFKEQIIHQNESCVYFKHENKIYRMYCGLRNKGKQSKIFFERKGLKEITKYFVNNVSSQKTGRVLERHGVNVVYTSRTWKDY